jgi:hypothetical protein
MGDLDKLLVCLTKQTDRLTEGQGARIVGSYPGTGTLRCLSGNELDCAFRVVQLATGQLLLFCVGPFKVDDDKLAQMRRVGIGSLSGNSEGRVVETQGAVGDGTSGPSPWGEYVICFHASRVLVSHPERAGRPCAVRFALTNLDLLPPNPVRLDLEGLGERRITIEPMADYEVAKERLRLLRSPQVTCTLTIPLQGEDDLEQAERCANDVCLLLSLAQGSKVSWLCRDVLVEDQEALQSRLLGSRVTGQWSSFRLVHRDLPEFLRKTYPQYLRRRESFKLNKGGIDAYVDARHGDQYLETQGAKLALALELPNTTVCAAAGIESSVLPESQFKEVKKRIKAAMEQALPGDGLKLSRQVLSNKVGDLNRRPFRRRLEEVLPLAGSDLSCKEVRLFVKSRNSLVHLADYRCKTAAASDRKRWPFSERIDEYRFMMHFMDRLLLKVVGYSGPYLDATEDWRTERRLP